MQTKSLHCSSTFFLAKNFANDVKKLLKKEGVNQKITIWAVRPQLGKQAYRACVPKCS